jgi:hypothetical protein
MLWTAFREWEGGVASTLGVANIKGKNTTEPLRDRHIHEFEAATPLRRGRRG